MKKNEPIALKRDLSSPHHQENDGELLRKQALKSSVMWLIFEQYSFACTERGAGVIFDGNCRHNIAIENFTQPYTDK